MNEQLIRAREVARLLDISRAQAYRLFQNGEIETVRIRKSVRCSMRALDQYIASHSSEGTKPNAFPQQ